MGACTWINESETVVSWIKGSMEMPSSPPGDHSSFQSKAAGQYGLLITLHYILSEHQEGGTIKVACNGQSVLDWLCSSKQINPFVARADLLSACRSIAAQLPCKVEFTNVKGHQDNGLPMVLSREVWLNIEADLSARKW